MFMPLTRGSVRVFSNLRGKKVELADLQASDFFGEIAFLTGKPRTATVETLEECDCSKWRNKNSTT